MREMNPNCESYQAPHNSNKLTLRQIINRIKKLFFDENVIANVNFHYASGFIVLHDGRIIYFSTLDERWKDSSKHILFRTAKHTKDYSGGANNFFDLDKASKSMIINTLWR